MCSDEPGMRIRDVPPDVNELTRETIAAAIEVHKAIGPGVLERVYATCLVHELRSRALSVETEVRVPVTYDGLMIEDAYRMDIVVERVLVVEVKAVEQVLPLHKAQVLTYLRLGGYPVGLLLNFHAPFMRDGIERVVNRRR